MSELDFNSFKSYLNIGDIDAAKRLVTPANVQTRDRYDYGVLWYFCWYGPDDPGLLFHFMELGVTLELDSVGWRSSPLHQTAGCGKPRLLRALLDLGIPVDILNCDKVTPLFWSLMGDQVECAWLLLDAGAQLSFVEKVGTFIPEWVREFVTKREQTRTSSVIILGLLRCNSKVTGQNGRDVLKMVARCMWRLRGL